jgi:GxxExxY protein
MTVVNEKYKHSALTGRIIRCAIEVQKSLGSGFPEVIYQRALKHELDLQRLTFVREMEMPVYYKLEQIGTRKVDFFVEGCIMLELKAVSKL